MEQRTDHLTATYVDLAVNVTAVVGTKAGMRVLQNNTPLLVVHGVLVVNASASGPWRGAQKVRCHQASGQA